MQVLKEIRKESKSNFLARMIFEKNFDETYRSVIVLANPKTYLNAKFAKRNIKDKVIRADQLIAYIRRMDASVKDDVMSLDSMRELATFFINHSQPARSDYARKYEELLAQTKVVQTKQESCAEAYKLQDRLLAQSKQCAPVEYERQRIDAVSRDEVVKRLKAYRLEQSRKENIKPYYIFNDAQVNDLIDKNPKTKEELLKVSGFGPTKVQKYGDDIIKCLEG